MITVFSFDPLRMIFVFPCHFHSYSSRNSQGLAEGLTCQFKHFQHAPTTTTCLSYIVVAKKKRTPQLNRHQKPPQTQKEAVPSSKLVKILKRPHPHKKRKQTKPNTD
jgi:hypothetical protein